MPPSAEMTYVPKKSSKPQAGINNGGGEYEGIWSGPIEVPVRRIRSSHGTSRSPKIAEGYEDKPLRVQRWPSVGYHYRIVDGNKRLARAKRKGQRRIWVYIWEGKYVE